LRRKKTFFFRLEKMPSEVDYSLLETCIILKQMPGPVQLFASEGEHYDSDKERDLKLFL